LQSFATITECLSISFFLFALSDLSFEIPNSILDFSTAMFLRSSKIELRLLLALHIASFSLDTKSSLFVISTEFNYEYSSFIFFNDSFNV